jgi:hypothetical protein
MTQQKAGQLALHSAIFKILSIYYSLNEDSLNNQLLIDLTTSITNDNIESYELLNETQMPDSNWVLLLKVNFSINKLKIFLQEKGIKTDLKVSEFALNIKQQMLNEQGEINALFEMVGLFHELMQNAFDYTIKSNEPKSKDNDNKNWELSLEVNAIANKNMDFCANYCISILSAICLSKDEVENYKSLNKTIYPVNINYKSETKIFYLRTQMSIYALNTLTMEWEFFTSLFEIQPEFDKIGDKCTGTFFDFSDGCSYRSDNKTINFLTAGKQAATFIIKDEKTLQQIEQINGYHVKPRGIVSIYKNGGIVVNQKDGHGLVVSIADLGKIKLQDIETFAKNLVLNGYNDWRIPTNDELNTIHKNLFENGIGGFAGFKYYGSYGGFGNIFRFQNCDDNTKYNQFVRVVRDF